LLSHVCPSVRTQQLGSPLSQHSDRNEIKHSLWGIFKFPSGISTCNKRVLYTWFSKTLSYPR
jgi:hypothetical protein